ncbi:hypothetical protein HOLleu_02878 [Holothuria leucospilota]|uniref:Endonuclease/exonuclease/phosphatase domain-containing protein n=1 Tax=Holothuria leucospilota TaxID=206669 RepID=A0A9Q1CSS8_HOLLE|nr:hypothetical protein HOLleu_02878 [Holothuria leucospilota]
MTLSSFVPGSAPCILAGDFNCVPDTQLDRMSTCTSSGCGVGMSELDMFVKNHDMVDVWRAQHPGLSVFTWHRPDGTPAFSTDLEWWDDVKSRIKQFTVEYCVARARRKREEFLSLCSRERNGDTSALYAIQQYLDQKLHGARVRARVHCVEAEEKPTIKFYRDVTKYAIDRRMRAVRDVHGTVQKDPLDIVEVFKTYEQLYTRADVDEGLQESLLDNIDKTPSKEQNDVRCRDTVFSRTSG